MLALDLGDRLQVGLVRLLDLAALVVLQPPHARAGGEVALGALDGRGRVEQPHARLQPRAQQHRVQHAVGVLEREPVLAVAVAGRERPHLLEVRAAVGLDHALDRLVGERLGEAQQRQAGRHPPQVPREVAEVGLVEVVDVEHEDPAESM